MDKVFNFCAGPAMLPEAVMQKAQAELINWADLGVSVMEVSHRSKEFMALTAQIEKNLRQLMEIPSNYHVLFMHGGGRGQFAAVVNNFLGNQGRALYLVNGQWSQAAAKEAQKLVGESSIDIIDIKQNINNKQSVNLAPLTDIKGNYRYLHYCPNETVDGIEIFDELECPWPVIADMSSCILSRKIDVNRFGLIYAGAQKNIGPSGLAVVIVREDLLSLPALSQASISDYRVTRDNQSMFNTPPTFSWYLAGEVFTWLLEQGGVAHIEKINQEKAELLYQCIDSNPCYQNAIVPMNRSKMNVTFNLSDSNLDQEFLSQAKERGLVGLKGHRLVGGMRASIYNAMPLAGVVSLTQFMADFAKQHGY